MEMLTVALLQMTACQNDQQANLEKGTRFCQQAKALGADVALFPEMWNIGYTPYSPEVMLDGFDPADPTYFPLRYEWQQQAVGSDSAFVAHFRALAKQLEMAIAITYLEAWPVAPRNTVCLIDRKGKIVLTYAKVHTCDFSLEAACTSGDDFKVCTLDTGHGLVEVGAMICYDREFPESARLLMLKGAEVILIPNACEMETNRINQLGSRAFENMLGVALTNYAAPQENGHSIAFDGMPFGAEGSRDMRLIEAGGEEGVYLATFDLAALREYRTKEAWADAFRKPRAYQGLLDSAVKPPFLRQAARR